jgi:hypothetical protein
MIIDFEGTFEVDGRKLPNLVAWQEKMLSNGVVGYGYADSQHLESYASEAGFEDIALTSYQYLRRSRNAT